MLLENESVNKNDFRSLIQVISPYWKEQIDINNIQSIDVEKLIKNEIIIPEPFSSETRVSENQFNEFIRNRKSGKVILAYYQFYVALFNYVSEPNNEHFELLKGILQGTDADKIEKAFGCGTNILHCGTKAKPYTFEQFVEANADSALLTHNLNVELYKKYIVSKYLDTAREYSDTTIRMLSATGLFQFAKPLVELSHK